MRLNLLRPAQIISQNTLNNLIHIQKTASPISARSRFKLQNRELTMKPQNIYDNEEFFEKYKELRSKSGTANDIEEKPAFFSLLPELASKKVLDLGCGYGENCAMFLSQGASTVIGMDLSEKMLDKAKKDHPQVTFIHGDMNDLSSIANNTAIPNSYDLIVSSLAMHYISDFKKLANEVYSLLTPNGYFVFSQEHPLTTAPINGVVWERDENNTALYYHLTDYTRSGERNVNWLVNGVIKYHRTFADIINALSSAGFIVETMLEPAPTPEIIAISPKHAKNIHKPNFMLIKARKI